MLENVFNELLVVDFSIKAADDSFIKYGQYHVHGKFFYADAVRFITTETLAVRINTMQAAGELLPCATGYIIQFNGQTYERRQTHK